MTSVRCLGFAFLACAALTTGGCGFIAKDGPAGPDLRSQAVSTSPAAPDAVNFVLVNASPDALREANIATFASAPRFGAMARGVGPDVSIGRGDILGVTIFEAEAGGLFLPKDGGGSRQGNFVQIPNQQVDESGDIVIPYIPRPVKVVGRTARDVAAEISESLKKRAIDPQTVVSIVEKRGNDISVLGDVNAPTKFSLDPGGTRLLTAIARAGGPKDPAYETTIAIQRNGVLRKAWMSTVVNDPSQNVPMRPGDFVYLSHEPRVFMVLGATPPPGAIGGVNNRRFPFTNEKMTLAEALSTAGGLDSTRSDPRQIFLFRFEKKDVLEKTGIDVARFTLPLVPTVYSIDMQQGSNFFMADAFYMRDKDIIFVSDAPAVDLQKVLNLVSSLSGSAYNSAEAFALTK